MSDSIAELKIRVDSIDAKLAKDAMEGLGNTSQWLEGIVTKLAAAFGAYKLAEIAKETVMLAARYDTLGVAMNVVGQNAGYTSSQMVALQRGLQDTGISMIESRNNLARMAAAQLDLNQASALGRVAQDAAVIAGINSSEAFERMVQGIVSGQPRILHTMGLFANFSVAEKKWAEEHGRTAESLSNVEKIQIRMNETLREGATRAGAYEASMGTAGKQMFSMQRYAQDLQVLLGGVFPPALTVAVFGLADALKDMAKWARDNAVALGELGRAVASDIVIFGEFTKLLGDLSGGANTANESVNFLAYTAKGVGFLFAGATDILRGFLGALEELKNVAAYDWDKYLNPFTAGKQVTYTQGHLLDPFRTGNTALTKWYDDNFGDKPKAATVDPDLERFKAGNQADARIMATVPSIPEANKDRSSLIQSLKEEAITLMGGKTALEDYKASLVGLTGSPILTLVQQFRQLAETKKIVDDEMASIGSYNGGIRGKQLDDALAIKAAYEQAIDPMLKYEERRKEIARLPFLNTEQRLFAEQKAWEELTEAGKKYVAMRAEGKQIEEQNQTPEERALANMTRLKAIQDSGGISLQGYEREWIKLQEQAGTAAGMVGEAWETSVNGMSTAFANFVTTGKGSFKSMVSSILADLARLQANRAFAQLLDIGLGVITGWFDVKDNAGNAGFSSNDLSSLNTSGGGGGGYTWTPPGQTIAPKGGGASSVQSNVNITITDGKATSDTQTTGKNAAEFGRMLEANNRQLLIKEMRPGGLLNPVSA